jgi:glycosyltransferase involved in cell wall biosynthesis
MKILHTVESYYPDVGGMAEVVRQLSERLARMGHEVTVATSRCDGRDSNPVAAVRIVEFEIHGNAVRGFKGEVSAYESFLIQSEFDVITNFAAQQWATDLMLPLLDRISGKKILVPTGFSGLDVPAYSAYFESMKGWMKRYDSNVFPSENFRDIEFARQAGVVNITVIPNGAAAEEFLALYPTDIRKKLRIPADDFLVLHVGSHTGLKGHAEAIRIFRRARCKAATFLLVGSAFRSGRPLRQLVRHCLKVLAAPFCGLLGRAVFPECRTSCRLRALWFNLSPRRLLDHRRIMVTSLSRQETVGAYQAADLLLFPSNIECSPIVLFESMASKTPFLTTDVGNAREIVGWSKSGVVLPTITSGNFGTAKIRESAAVLEALCRDQQLRRDMQLAGFAAWESRFTWEKIALQYEALYRNLM